MIDKIDSVVNAIGGFLYQPYIVPLFLIVAGLYFTIRTGLIQFRLFGESIHVVAEKPKEKGSISSFGALMVSTASRVGTGNIVGVSTAICLGGFGAVFWMWVVALLGGASAFIESALAQVYKKKDGKGGCVGGPSYYMEQALHQRWLGVIFAVVLILTYVVGYNMLASYNLQDAFAGFGFYAKGRTPYIIGAILAVLFAACVLGGGKRLTNITGVLVPVMGVLYILVSLVVIFMNIKIFPSVIANIFRDAFNFKAAFSGFAGSCIMWGIKRGLYSNEAGMGSAPNAAATADVSHPAKQGLVQMLSVFIDTLLICSATAFMCLCSGVVPTKEPYQKRTSHGMILGEGGEKMSKSRGNVVNPNDIVDQYGADTMRLHIMFIGDFEKAVTWSNEAVKGSKRFLDRVWNLAESCTDDPAISDKNEAIIHKTIKKVTEDIDELKMNTAIASMMTMVNEFAANGCTKGDMEQLLLLLSPFAPHIVEELWERLGFAAKYGKMCCQCDWPTYDETKTVDTTVTMAVQVLGKLKGTVTVAKDSDQQTVVDAALQLDKVQRQMEGMQIVKVIHVPNKLVNLILKPKA